jgi:hypothetical protein
LLKATGVKNDEGTRKSDVRKRAAEKCGVSSLGKGREWGEVELNEAAAVSKCRGIDSLN